MSKQIEAMKMALEALQESWRTEKGDKAITALREVLAEQETAVEKPQQSAEKPSESRADTGVDGGGQKEIVGADWTPCVKLPVVVHVRKQRPGEAHVSTREGLTPVKPDDLIMRGVLGEEYPIGRAIFEQTYSLDTTTQAQPK